MIIVVVSVAFVALVALVVLVQFLTGSVLLTALAGFGGIVAIALISNRITGARAHYIDEWVFEEDEQVLFRDDKASVRLETKWGEADTQLPSGTVIVTSKRILAGVKPLGSKRVMLQYLLYPGDVPGSEDSKKLGGGALTRGYQTLVFLPESTQRVAEDDDPRVVLVPSPDAASSTNIKSIVIRTSKAVGFPLPA